MTRVLVNAPLDHQGDSGQNESGQGPSDGPSRGVDPPLLLWRTSPEYHALFPTKHDGKSGDRVRKDELSFGEGATFALLAAGILTAAAIALQVLLTAPSVAQNEFGRVTIRVLQTVGLSIAAGMVTAVVFRYMGARKAFFNRVRAIRANEVRAAVDQLGEALPLAQLFRLNRRQLDEYHVLSVRQASATFRNATVASAIAFLILVGGAVYAIQIGEDASSRYVAGGLAGLGAVLSAFLSDSFFRSYKEAAQQLQGYYEEPARTGRILALERLAQDSQRSGFASNLQELLVKELLADYCANGGRRDEHQRPTIPSNG